MLSGISRKSRAFACCFLTSAAIAPTGCKQRTDQASSAKSVEDGSPAAGQDSSAQLAQMGQSLRGGLGYLRALQDRNSPTYDPNAAENIMRVMHLDFLRSEREYKAFQLSGANQTTSTAFRAAAGTGGAVALGFWPLLTLGTLVSAVSGIAGEASMLGSVGGILSASGVVSIGASIDAAVASLGFAAPAGGLTPGAAGIAASAEVLAPALLYGVIAGEVVYVAYEVHTINKYYGLASNFDAALKTEETYKAKLVDLVYSNMVPDVKRHVVCNFDKMMAASGKSFADVPQWSYTFGYMSRLARDSNYQFGSADPCTAAAADPEQQAAVPPA